MSSKIHYIGRFAPSPTGPLHFGSMVAAVGSYLQARSHAGIWRVRIEDLDPPREMPGAASDILRTLEIFGLHWDGEVMFQSQRSEAYLAALEELRCSNALYPCTCSRKEIAASAAAGQYGLIYTGHCRVGTNRTHGAQALRVLTHNTSIAFKDAIRGRFSQRIETECGDFVVRRADGLFAYQLAVVVDDAAQGITEVVRGSDLLDNTPRQIHLQQLLRYPSPGYVHLPVALNTQGQKLSKQAGAEAIGNQVPSQAVIEVLKFLGQRPPNHLGDCRVGEILGWAIDHWDLNKIPASDKIILAH